MVEHVYDRVSMASTVEAVVVATDDDRIAEAVDRFGGIAVMTSPDHATGTDRLAEVASALSGPIVVNVQGDEPLIDPDAIDAAVRPMLRDSALAMSTLRRILTDPADVANPGVVKVAIDLQGYALYFSRSPVPYVRPGSPATPEIWGHLGLYVYRRELLGRLAALPATPLEQAEGLEQLRALEHGIRILTVPTLTHAIGVDTPEDLERVRRLVEPVSGVPANE
jgi:3-deoxy-manno-octulosonate cytidylyltransferase (CMP-KDO synthetase)